MKTYKKIWCFSSVLVVVIFFLLGKERFEGHQQMNKDKESAEYPNLENSYHYEFSGRVTKRGLSKNWGVGTYLFDLSTGKNFTLSQNTINYKYKKNYQALRNSLFVNDSIYKPKNSDTVYVYKEKDTQFYYILGRKIK